jgi:hypothetical protein
MFYRFLPLLIISALISLSLATKSAVTQSKPDEVPLEVFNPIGPPVLQVEPTITMTPFDPNDPSSLGNRPRGMVRYREFMRDTQGISRGVIVGNPGYRALLEANKVAFFIRFVSNPEFLALYPGTMSPADFVDALNTNTGGVLSGDQRNDLINGLLQLKETRATVVRKIAENQTLPTRSSTAPSC